MSVQNFKLIASANRYQYAYSTWAPQYAQRLKLSSTESNLIVRSTIVLAPNLLTRTGQLWQPWDVHSSNLDGYNGRLEGT